MDDKVREAKASTSEEIERMIKHAQEQPGIAELMEAYGRYDEFVKQADAYLSSFRPKDIISTTDSTA